ncbi:MAG TPA: glycoside hydrolase family 32 protein [Anaerolineaceae bacterium]|nr:glycoside hydrolase family 32 protein [Anaerolineaceae bacterium]HPN53129.1 glycoside hydrolase family 32 protein [Anaerolineaceae bacterium]
MPAIPEFVLRKLFVPGSLAPCGSGFKFEMNNTFAPVTLLGLGISADEKSADVQSITLSLPGHEAVPAAAIHEQQPFSLPVNVIVSVQVLASEPKNKLTIQALTREAGLLQFSIPVKSGAKTGLSRNPVKEFSQQLTNYFRAQRARRDPQHPRLHFTPPANWMNDPNGLIFWQGNVHLFYQTNPLEPAWGNIHWGHAVSKDMLHWRHLPLALSPDPNGADAGGCFSGCAVIHEGIPTLLYTGVYPEVQCLAMSPSPNLVRWQKHPQPVIPAPPPGLSVEGFRDPCVWKEGREWLMTLGSGIKDVGGAVLLYRSQDLRSWSYAGILFQGDALSHHPLWTGTMWECPSFFPLEDKWVLILSVCGPEGGLYTIYYTGQFTTDRFIPDNGPHLLDTGAGGCYYAPQTFLDEKGRRIIFGWLREARSAADQARAGWSGAMSLPRVLTLGNDGRVHLAPLEALSTLRQEHERLNLSNLKSRPIRDVPLELLVTFPRPPETWSGITLTSDASSGERIKIGFDPDRSLVVTDCTQAGGLLSETPISPDPDQTLTFHIFIDGSTLEVYIQDRLPVSARFYLTGKLQVHCAGPVLVDIWKLII